MAAASSYYLTVTIAPLLVILILLVQAIAHAVSGLQLDVALSAPAPSSGLVTVADRYLAAVGQNGTIIALGIALFGATVFITAFIKSLDKVFALEGTKPAGWRVQVRRRLLALLALVVLVLAMIATSVLVALLEQLIEGVGDVLVLGIAVPSALEQASSAITWVTAAALFLIISASFTYLPQRRIRWRDSLVGALLTTVAFTIGQAILGVYLSNSSVVSAFGAMSAFLAFLIWVYYTMQVVLSGAVFTRVWADDAEARRSSKLQSSSSGEDE